MGEEGVAGGLRGGFLFEGGLRLAGTMVEMRRLSLRPRLD